VPEIHAAATANAITCGGCTNTWTGLSRCHCSGCHRTFGGVRAFDLHRRPRGRHGSCVDPAILTTGAGAPLLIQRNGIWCQPPMDADTVARVAGATS
jgi:hypothetical protein